MPNFIFPDSPPIPIRKQPNGDYTWVADGDDITEFGHTKLKYGVPTYGAHSYNSGKRISNLKIGDEVIYQDNVDSNDSNLYFSNKKFKVTKVHMLQALKPNSVYSPFKDINTGKQYGTTDDMFKALLANEKGLVFQTCIEKDGNKSWGRMFVVAE